MKTIFRKLKQEMKTENENANQTHVSTWVVQTTPLRSLIYVDLLPNLETELVGL